MFEIAIEFWKIWYRIFDLYINIIFLYTILYIFNIYIYCKIYFLLSHIVKLDNIKFNFQKGPDICVRIRFFKKLYFFKGTTFLILFLFFLFAFFSPTTSIQWCDDRRSKNAPHYYIWGTSRAVLFKRPSDNNVWYAVFNVYAS